jgi:hypothetical protein
MSPPFPIDPLGCSLFFMSVSSTTTFRQMRQCLKRENKIAGRDLTQLDGGICCQWPSYITFVISYRKVGIGLGIVVTILDYMGFVFLFIAGGKKRTRRRRNKKKKTNIKITAVSQWHNVSSSQILFLFFFFLAFIFSIFFDVVIVVSGPPFFDMPCNIGSPLRRKTLQHLLYDCTTLSVSKYSVQIDIWTSPDQKRGELLGFKREIERRALSIRCIKHHVMHLYTHGRRRSNRNRATRRRLTNGNNQQE